jgi:hypothetical protein
MDGREEGKKEGRTNRGGFRFYFHVRRKNDFRSPLSVTFGKKRRNEGRKEGRKLRRRKEGKKET